MSISDETRTFLQSLRDPSERVLTDFVPEELRLDETGAIVVVCSDCHQRKDMSAFLARVAEACGVSELYHKLKVNAAGIALDPDSSLHRKGKHRLLTLEEDIRDTMLPSVKGITTVILIAHFPCGKAGLEGISDEEQMQSLLVGKARLKEHLYVPRVVCAVHVDWGGHNRRMYRITRRDWEAWCHRHDRTPTFRRISPVAPSDFVVLAD
ncbi:TPA: hypothetical protein DDZ10_00365 [Candidatus Uhrbacteria bacterium]|nr:hypothetical protein [Candidatus Uhrbacteria bacterium]